jgi:hypothetical protein
MTDSTQKLTAVTVDDNQIGERHTLATEYGTSNAADPATVYRNFLLDLPEKIEFLYDHFDDVVGHGLEFPEAAKTLEDAIGFFEMLLDAESALAEEPAEMDVAPCGA